MKKMEIRKGDTVIVLSGVEKGKQGKVLHVYRKKRAVIVEKLRLLKRHTKPGRAGMAQGGIVEREGPIHMSSVALIDPKTGEPTRIRHQLLEDGTRIRIAAGSGDTIEKPKE